MAKVLLIIATGPQVLDRLPRGPLQRGVKWTVRPLYMALAPFL